jgi:ketosteroid isomerase-like protein
VTTFINILLTIIVATVGAGAASAWDWDAADGIDDVQEHMRVALKEGDVDAMLDFYADGFRLYAPFKPVCDSRDELAKRFQYAMDFGLWDFELKREELLGSGDQVVEIGHIVFIDRSGNRMAGQHYMTFWVKEGGRWRILLDMATAS